MGGLLRQPTSRWVGLAVAGAYVMITAITGTALLVAGRQIGAADAQSGPSAGAFAQYTDTITITNDPRTLPNTRTTTRPAPTTVTTDVTVPRPSTHQASPTRPTTHTTAGYRKVTGPAGMSTVVPTGWTQARSTAPGADIAVDPGDDQCYAKFGGAAIPDDDILATHVLYEATYATHTTGYHRLALAETTFHGTDAVGWEYRFDGPGGTQHAKSLYWRERGTEYFVLVSGPEQDWSRMSATYQQMVAAAKP